MTNVTVSTHCSFIRYEDICDSDKPSQFAFCRCDDQSCLWRKEFIFPYRLQLITERSLGSQGGKRWAESQAETVEEHCIL